MLKLKKGDNVQVTVGKDKGRTGSVERVLAKEGKVFVGGVNMFKRHVRKVGDHEGGIIDLIKPLDVSKVVLICPNCKKMTRVGFKVTDTGKIRICKKCGKEIGK